MSVNPEHTSKSRQDLFIEKAKAVLEAARALRVTVHAETRDNLIDAFEKLNRTVRDFEPIAALYAGADESRAFLERWRLVEKEVKELNHQEQWLRDFTRTDPNAVSYRDGHAYIDQNLLPPMVEKLWHSESRTCPVPFSDWFDIVLSSTRDERDSARLKSEQDLDSLTSFLECWLLPDAHGDIGSTGKNEGAGGIDPSMLGLTVSCIAKEVRISEGPVRAAIDKAGLTRSEPGKPIKYTPRQVFLIAKARMDIHDSMVRRQRSRADELKAWNGLLKRIGEPSLEDKLQARRRSIS